MSCIKAIKTISEIEDENILDVTEEMEQLGLKEGDEVVVYYMRPEDVPEFESTNGVMYQYYIVFSDPPIIIRAQTLDDAIELAGDHIVVGGIFTMSQVKNYLDILTREISRGLEKEWGVLQKRMEELQCNDFKG